MKFRSLFVSCLVMFTMPLDAETLKEWCGAWLLMIDNVRKLRFEPYGKSSTLERIVSCTSRMVITNLEMRLRFSSSLKEELSDPETALFIFDTFIKLLSIDFFYAEVFYQALEAWQKEQDSEEYYVLGVALECCALLHRYKNIDEQYMEKIF